MLDGPETAARGEERPAAPSRRHLRARTDGRGHRRRLLTYLLLFGSAVLMVNALVGEHGYLASIRASREQEAAEAQLRQLQFEDQRLLEQVNRLKSDPAALEEEARRQLGLIRPGETLVVIHDAPPTGSSPR